MPPEARSHSISKRAALSINKPAKLLDSNSLTLKSSLSRFGPVYLYLTFAI
jgi:hypothetical protein